MHDIKLAGYLLAPLRSIQQDDIRAFLGARKGVYICPCPTDNWFRKQGIRQVETFHSEKKLRMFAQMAEGSFFISPTPFLGRGISAKATSVDGIFHLVVPRLPRRLIQGIHIIQVIAFLIRNHSRFTYCLVYNFEQWYYLAALFAKYVLGKKLYVDFEDDYLLRNPSRLSAVALRLTYRAADGVICIHEEMRRYFKMRRAITFNAFADLSYISTTPVVLREGMSFLYSGTIDAIRGADLIPTLVLELRKSLSSFRIVVTGSGPLEKEVSTWRLPEVDFKGFLSNNDLTQLVSNVDACLVLQRPDHSFCKGSFPSKIDLYARFKKPILVLRTIRPRGNS